MMAFSCDPALTRKPAPLTFLERAVSLQPAVLVLALPPYQPQPLSLLR
ncbi:MAG: hypothetical protein AB7I98_05400 [Verrucomicrobiales bacterium]